VAVKAVIRPGHIAPNCQNAYSHIVKLVVEFVHTFAVAHDRVKDKGKSEAENDPCEESREDELVSWREGVIEKEGKAEPNEDHAAQHVAPYVASLIVETQNGAETFPMASES